MRRSSCACLRRWPVIRDRLHGEIRAAIEAGTVGPLGSRLYFCGVQDLDFLVQRLKHEIPAGVPDIVLGLAQRISLVCTRQERVLAPKSAKALVTLFLNQSTCNLPALSEVAVYFNGVPMLRFMKALSLKALDKFQVLFSTFGDGQKYYLVSSAIYDSDFELAGKALALPMDASFAVPNTESMINTSLLLGAITLQAPVNIIRGLLARGANPDDQISDGGSTVLEYVLEKGRDTQWVEEVTLCLLEYRARATPRLTYAEAMETMGAVPRGLMSAFAFEHKDPIQLARAKQCSTKTISAIEAALKREAEHQAARDKRAGATREAAIASGGGGNEGD